MTPTGLKRRGAVGVGMVMVLVVTMLVIVGAVVAEARDENLTVQRVDSTRAFYAAESGVNMALREVMVGADEDGDGTIGTISNNGNASDDPALGGARFSVARALVGAATDITSAARSGLARRSADAQVKGVIGGQPQTVMVAYSRPGSPTPRYAKWTPGGWTSSQNMPDIAGEAKWVRMKICPTRNETTFISEDLNKHVNVCFFNGTSWSTVSLLSSDTGGLNDRPEDIAYEQLSSNALCVYWKGTIGKFGYRQYDGANFLAEQIINNPFSTEDDFLSLCPRPASNDIFLLAADGIAGGPLVSARWDGTSFGTWTQLIPSLESNNQECYAMAFEAQSGKGVAVYTESGVTSPRFRTITGSTWSSQSSLPATAGVGKWLRLAADPTSNAILFASLDGFNSLNANVWNGSTWGANQVLENNCPDFQGRYYDVIFERGTGNALLVYAEKNINTPRYRTWNGTTWSAEKTGPDLGAPVELVNLSRGFANGEVFLAISDSLHRLHVLRWDGLSLSGDTVIESNLGGWMQYFSFALPEPTVAPHPRVLSWNEIPSQ